MNREQLERLIRIIPNLSEGQLMWLEKVVNLFTLPCSYEARTTEIFNKTTVNDFGDALKVHHAFSVEAFTKDKFEYVLAPVYELFEGCLGSYC